MSIWDEDKGHDEYAEFSYYSREADGKIVRHETKLQEAGFDTMVHAFLDWAQAVYSWDRAVMKVKAFEAVNEWEL
jgi:hypothetical protein